MNARDTQILESTMGNFGSVAIIGTVAITGDFTAIHCIEDTVVSASVDTTGYNNADLSTFTTLLAGDTVYGNWSSITLSSGSIMAYYGR